MKKNTDTFLRLQLPAQSWWRGGGGERRIWTRQAATAAGLRLALLCCKRVTAASSQPTIDCSWQPTARQPTKAPNQTTATATTRPAILVCWLAGLVLRSTWEPLGNEATCSCHLLPGPTNSLPRTSWPLVVQPRMLGLLGLLLRDPAAHHICEQHSPPRLDHGCLFWIASPGGPRNGNGAWRERAACRSTVVWSLCLSGSD
jgi:hypothetical protein